MAEALTRLFHLLLVAILLISSIQSVKGLGSEEVRSKVLYFCLFINAKLKTIWRRNADEYIHHVLIT
jgi:hypothetical protein